MKKILLLILALILSLALYSCGNEETGAPSSSGEGNINDVNKEPVYKATIKLDENASLGYLSGKLAADTKGVDYDVYFGNGKGKLKGYTKLGKCQGELVLDGVVVPPEATTVIMVSEKEECVAKIPEECVLFGKDAFIFGVLSDVHYNKYYSDGVNDDALFAFDNALDYFDNIGADLVGVTGDLSNDGEESALVNFNEAIKDRSYPVYTVTGNHDMNAYYSGKWAQHITNNLESCELAPNGLDFTYTSEETGDMFVFFNITKYSYSNKSEAVVFNKQLEWLENTLDANPDKQIYLFFHLFLCGPDGEAHTGVGNIMNPGGYTYPLPYKYNNFDERRFRRLMKTYKNVMYFSGHSHWMFEMEIYGEQTNFSTFDGEYCTMVHVPSVTEPRWIGESDTDRTGKHGVNSQGWAIYDYGEVRVLVPIDFITGTVYTEYMEIAK